MVEYAILLAFIVVVSLVFINNNNISGSINTIIAKTASLFGAETGNKQPAGQKFIDFADQLDKDAIIMKINGQQVEVASTSQFLVYYASSIFKNLNGEYKEMSIDEYYASLANPGILEEYKTYPENTVLFSDGKKTSTSSPDVYMAWTNGTPSEGETVKVMVAKIDGTKTQMSGKDVYTNKALQYYVVESTYKNGSFTKDIVDSGKLSALNNENALNAEAAFKEFNK